MHPDGTHSPVFLIQTLQLLKNIDFGQIGGWFLKSFKTNLTCIYSGFVNRICEHLNKFGPVAFALSLGPHSDNNIQTYIFGFWGPQNRHFHWKLNINFCWRSQYFLYRLHSIVGKITKFKERLYIYLETFDFVDMWSL